MRTAVRAQVVEQLKRRCPATTYELFELCKRFLPEDVLRESSDEIIELWQHQQRRQRQHNELSLPLSPAPSSSTQSHWSPSDVRRSLSLYPQCIGDSDPLPSAFVLPAEGSWYLTESKSHNGPGSYITVAILTEAEVNFEKEGWIKLQCRPPKDQHGPSATRDSSQSRQSCRTLFNIVSKEEADHIGMTNFHILYGADFNHDIDQQHRAERIVPEPIPPRAPTPPNRRGASPSESTISMGSRLEPRPTRHQSQGGASGYSMTYKNQYGEELALTAPRSESNFLSSVEKILPRLPAAASAAASLLGPSPMLIQGAAGNQNPRNINNRGLESQYPMGHTVPSIPPSDYMGFEHGQKRKATDDVAPTPARRPWDL